MDKEKDMILKASESKKATDEIPQVIEQKRRDLAQAIRIISDVDTYLGGVAATYKPIMDGIDAAVSANPGNVFWEKEQAAKNLFAAEFVALKQWSAGLKTATAGVAKP